MIGGVLAAIVAAVALLLNWRRTENDTKRLDNEAVRLENDRQRLVNDTYVKAIEQLGHAKMEVRLGAIYALERIAATDRDYHWPIMETLCAYIRERPASKWGRSRIRKPERTAIRLRPDRKWTVNVGKRWPEVRERNLSRNARRPMFRPS